MSEIDPKKLHVFVVSVTAKRKTTATGKPVVKQLADGIVSVVIEEEVSTWTKTSLCSVQAHSQKEAIQIATPSGMSFFDPKDGWEGHFFEVLHIPEHLFWEVNALNRANEALSQMAKNQ